MAHIWSREELGQPMVDWLSATLQQEDLEQVSMGGLLTIRLSHLPDELEALYDSVDVGVIVVRPSGSVHLQVRGTRDAVRRQLDLLEATQELETLLDSDHEPEPEGLLTDEERAALLDAFEAGYFDVPRQTRLSDLADDLGKSQGALSTLIRRGIRRLVEAHLNERLDTALVDPQGPRGTKRDDDGGKEP